MTLCKRTTANASSCEHIKQRVNLMLSTLPCKVTPAESYHIAMSLLLAILEQSPVGFLDISKIYYFCQGNTDFTPYPMTADERYLYDRQLREEGLSPLDALVQPVQARVEVIRATDTAFRLRA